MNEACHFVGSRLARTISVCDAGVCSNVFRLPSGTFAAVGADGGSAVLCAEAQLILAEFLAADFPDCESTRSVHTQELLHRFGSTVMPLLTLWAFGTDSGEDKFPELRDFELTAKCLAAEDIFEWRMFTVPFFLESVEVDQARQLYEFVIHAGQTRAFTHGRLISLLQVALHFYFDLAALLGHHFLALESVAAAARIVQASEPRYRPVRPWESDSGYSWDGVPDDVMAVVAVSGAIERLGGSLNDLRQSDLALITKVMIGWHASEYSSTKVLISYQILHTVCVPIIEVAAKLIASNAGQLAISVLDLCRPVLPVSQRIEVRDLLTSQMAQGPPPDDFHAGVSAAAYLSNNDVCWSLGLPILTTRPAASSTVRILLGNFAASKIQWVSTLRGRLIRFAASEDAKALGRAIGLAILHEVGLQPLQLHPELGKWLHPRIRMAVGDLAHVRATIAPTTLEQLLFMSWGLGEVLGPGGFEMYSNNDWNLLVTSTSV